MRSVFATFVPGFVRGLNAEREDGVKRRETGERQVPLGLLSRSCHVRQRRSRRLDEIFCVKVGPVSSATLDLHHVIASLATIFLDLRV